jgi:hypothetical protein
MANRWIVIGLNFFAVATLAGLAFALLGPIHLVRVLGLVATACGGAGVLLHAAALHRASPDRLVRWRERIAAPSTAPTSARSMAMSRDAVSHVATA